MIKVEIVKYDAVRHFKFNVLAKVNSIPVEFIAILAWIAPMYRPNTVWRLTFSNDLLKRSKDFKDICKEIRKELQRKQSEMLYHSVHSRRIANARRHTQTLP